MWLEGQRPDSVRSWVTVKNLGNGKPLGDVLALEQRYVENIYFRGAWRAQLVEHAALDLGVVSLSPMLGVEVT